MIQGNEAHFFKVFVHTKVYKLDFLCTERFKSHDQPWFPSATPEWSRTLFSCTASQIYPDMNVLMTKKQAQ